VIELLGEGAWSKVYRARPRETASDAPADYALKLAKTIDGRLATAARLLQREARVARMIAHPHLTSVLAAHLRRPPYYLVLPFLEGASLQAALEAAERLAIPHALWIARQAATALQALHEQGWVHGDVKPSNLLIAADGHTTLLDLSLARRADGHGGRSDAPWAGTLAYAAPETFGTLLPYGPASDVYSLGATLYEMWTGSRPFPATTAGELAQAHLNAPPPDPRRHNPRLPHRAVRLLRSMLAKEPTERPVGAELVAWLMDLEIDTFDDRWAA
jgi:serine/threonine-protein kinase